MLEDLCIISGAVPGGEYLFIYSQMHYDAVLYAGTFLCILTVLGLKSTSHISVKVARRDHCLVDSLEHRGFILCMVVCMTVASYHIP